MNPPSFECIGWLVKERRGQAFPIVRFSENFFWGGERMAENKKGEIVEYELLTIKEKVIADMKGLGTYKPEYDNLIDIYADLLFQYEDARQKFIQSGYQYETETAAGGTKKSAIVATLENLRKDIIAYSDRLCLNPKSVETVTTEVANKSKLASVLSAIE